MDTPRSYSPASPLIHQRRELLIKLTLTIVAPLFLLFFVEVLSYLWERNQSNGKYAWELVASRRIQWIPFFEPGAGYTLLKPESSYEWKGISVEINSHGLRDYDTSYHKPENTVRILNLGDSIAMGWGVQLEDTYGKKVEQLFNKDYPNDFEYEVINAGVPGWNLENELAYLQAKGLNYEPDLILWEITIVNDINGVSALQKQNRPASIEWLRTNTYAWPFLITQLHWIKAYAGGRERIEIIDPPTDPAKYFPLDPNAQRWKRTLSLISDMNKLAEENEALISIIMFPIEFQVLDENFPTLAQNLIMEIGEEIGIPVIDLLPVYQKACLEKPGGACQLEDRYLFADVWMHPSAHGHTLAANEIMLLLDEIWGKQQTSTTDDGPE